MIRMESQALDDFQVWAVECDICKYTVHVPVLSRDHQRSEEYVIRYAYTRGWFIGFKMICPPCLAAIKH